MKKEDGGPAFPAAAEQLVRSPSGELVEASAFGKEHHAGMSLREYFAAHAPLTLIDANESLHQHPTAKKFAKLANDVFPMEMLIKELARMRAIYADAMVAERQAGEV